LFGLYSSGLSPVSNGKVNYASYGALVRGTGAGAAFLVGEKIPFTAKSTDILYLAVNYNRLWYGETREDIL
jgi:hypothetical protein